MSIVNELHQYHRTVAERIAPIVEYSAYRERYPSKYEMKECSSVPITWKAVNEVIYCYFKSHGKLRGVLKDPKLVFVNAIVFIGPKVVTCCFLLSILQS